MIIHFLRHGRTLANERGLYYGSTDLPLSDRGVAELHELKATIPYPEAEIHVTSALGRAKETLLILYGKKPDRTIPELNEFDFGEFEMKGYDELQVRPDFRRWVRGTDDTPCPGGDSHNGFVARIRRGLEILHGLDAETVLVVCHGGVIGTLMQALFPGEKEHYYAWVPDCGLGYTVGFSGNRPECYKPIEPLAS